MCRATWGGNLTWLILGWGFCYCIVRVVWIEFSNQVTTRNYDQLWQITPLKPCPNRKCMFGNQILFGDQRFSCLDTISDRVKSCLIKFERLQPWDETLWKLFPFGRLCKTCLVRPCVLTRILHELFAWAYKCLCRVVYLQLVNFQSSFFTLVLLHTAKLFSCSP